MPTGSYSPCPSWLISPNILPEAVKPVYIPRPVLILMIIVYLLFLFSVDWINQPDGAWYRPFLIGLGVVLVAAWIHRERDSDEL